MGKGSSGKSWGGGRKSGSNSARAREAERAAEAARQAEEARRREEATREREREERAANAARERELKKPATGKVIQEDFIDAVKHYLNIDLSKARDTQFDSRSTFNIDTRELDRADLQDLRRFVESRGGKIQNRVVGYYDVKLVNNGANRLGIQVKYVKPKK